MTDSGAVLVGCHVALPGHVVITPGETPGVMFCWVCVVGFFWCWVASFRDGGLDVVGGGKRRDPDEIKNECCARGEYVKSVRSKNGVVVAAGDLGKIKSFLQMIAIIFLLLHDWEVYATTFYTISAGVIGEKLLLASIIFSYWSGIEYTCKVLFPKPSA